MGASTEEADGFSREPLGGDVLSFLEQALIILDQNWDRPDLGARVQEVIDAVREGAATGPLPVMQVGGFEQ